MMMREIRLLQPFVFVTIGIEISRNQFFRIYQDFLIYGREYRDPLYQMLSQNQDRLHRHFYQTQYVQEFCHNVLKVEKDMICLCGIHVGYRLVGCFF